MIWKQCRDIRREPTRNKGIHLVISVSFFLFVCVLVRLLMQFIRGEELYFFCVARIYINPSRRSVFSTNHRVYGAT